MLATYSGYKKPIIFLALNCKYKGIGPLLLACGSWIMAIAESIPSVYSSGAVFAVRSQQDEVVYPTLCSHTEPS